MSTTSSIHLYPRTFTDRVSPWAKDWEGNSLYTTSAKVARLALNIIFLFIPVLLASGLDRLDMFTQTRQLQGIIEAWKKEEMELPIQGDRDVIYRSRSDLIADITHNNKTGGLKLTLSQVPQDGLSSLLEKLASIPSLHSLDLSNNQLTTLPNEIGGLRNLNSLSLSDNQLTTLPNEIGGLRNLWSLYLSNNQLTTLPNEIGDLRNLWSLNLSNNQLTTLPNEIGNLIKLEWLYLSRNQLTTLPNEIGNLIDLESLDLSNNQLTALPNHFWNLPESTYINLTHNRFTANTIHEMNEHLTRRGRRIEINVWDDDSTQLSSLPDAIGNLSHLRGLDLVHNPLASLPDDPNQRERLNLSIQLLLQIIGNQFNILVDDHANENILLHWSEDRFQAEFAGTDWNAFSQELQVPVDASYLTNRKDLTPWIEQLTPDDQHILKLFLYKLVNSPDFENVSHKKYILLLMDRIFQLAYAQTVLQRTQVEAGSQPAESISNFQLSVWSIFREGSETCRDRAVYALFELEILWLFHHKNLSDEEYAELSIQAERYFFIKDYAKKEDFAEEIERLVYYCKKLKNGFNLPITIYNMAYERVGKNPQKLQTLQELLLQMTPRQLLLRSQHFEERCPLSPEEETAKGEIHTNHVTMLEDAEEYFDIANEAARQAFLDHPARADFKNLITTNTKCIDLESTSHEILEKRQEEIKNFPRSFPDRIERFLVSLREFSLFNQVQLNSAIETWKEEGALIDQENRDETQAVYKSRNALVARIKQNNVTEGLDLKLSHVPQDGLSSLFEKLASIPSLHSLDLSNNQLTILPDEIGLLTNLTRLWLSNNQLTILPDSIGNLTNLDWLNLSDNQLRTLPNKIGNLTKLAWLDLSINQLIILPDSIGNLTNLDWLNLLLNQLITLPSSIGNLTKLRNLFLSHNYVTTLPDSIGNLTNLDWLDLGYNQLTTLPDLRSLTQLKHLLLSYNEITTLSNDFWNLPESTYINLRYNQFSENAIQEMQDHLTRRSDKVQIDFLEEDDLKTAE